MKSITKMMVIAMVLLAALVIAPAAARGATVDDIDPGDTIYVGEENLNFDAAFGAVTRLVHYSDPSAGAADKIIAVVDPTDFDLIASAVGTTTGTYYALEATDDIGTSPAGLPFVVVDIPNVALDVVLNNSPTNSVNGRTVTRQNVLAFKVTNNLAGLAGFTGTAAPSVDIEVFTPGGGTLNQFGGATLTQVAANGTTQWVYNVNLTSVATGTYTAQAKWPGATTRFNDFYNKGYNSNTVSFEVLSKRLAIESNKDTVVRGNTFVVTITGESVTTYRLFVKDVGTLADNQYPLIAPGQPGLVTVEANARNTTVSTTAGGTRAIQFNTSQTTDERTFTIRVEAIGDTTTYDEVRVKIEKGQVTITAAGTGVYYIGEEIVLSGTNTDSNDVYLFITGPNLGTAGRNLRLSEEDFIQTGIATNFTSEPVEADDTWEFRWDTSDLDMNIDAGTYTVYAVSTPATRNDLSGRQYASTSVVLRSGFITASVSSAIVAIGDDMTITGTAQGNPSEVYVWIFGRNFRELATPVTVEADGTFEHDFDTNGRTPGQYFVVVQHPMTGGPGVTASGTRAISTDNTDVDLSQLQAANAASAVTNLLNSPNVDDTYTRLTFMVENAWIRIDQIGDQSVGSTFTISGTTNLAAGNELLIDVTSASFQPTEKTEASEFSGASGTATIEAGDGVNTWSFEVDATGFIPDEYIVNVESVETDTSTTATFNVVEATATPTPTATATPGDQTPTPTPTAATPTPTPTPAPGFGAVVALIGLGAVAFLVMRRN
jgi:trimeric autotransporter adhesin